MFKAHIRRTLLCTAIGILLAFIVIKLTKPMYEGRVEMLLGDEGRSASSGTNIFTPDVSSILYKNATSGASTERQLLSSQSIFYQALAKVDDDKNLKGTLTAQFPELYKLYDIESARTPNVQVDTGVAIIRVRAYSADLAADIANTISDRYDAVRKENSARSVSEALTYLSNQLTQAQKDLSTAEQKLKDYKNSKGIADMGKYTVDQTNQLTQLEQKRQSIESDITGADAELAQIQQQMARTDKIAKAGSSQSKSGTLVSFETELAGLQSQREKLLATYLPDAVPIRNIDDAIAGIKARIQEVKKNDPKSFGGESSGPNPIYTQLETNLNIVQQRRMNLTSQSAKVEAQIAAQKTLVGALPDQETQVMQLTRDVAIFDDKYKRLKSQAEDLRNRSETAVRAALVLNTAVADTTPVAPDTKKFLLIGATSGISAGLLLSFIIESLKLRIQSSTQLTALTGLPVVASLPVGTKTGAKALRLLGDPSASPPEAFRYMAFSLVTNNSKTMRTFMFTGIKTALTTYSSACQFALAVAQSGTKVLLVDGDMLRSPVTKTFDAGGKPGLSNLLAAETSVTAQDLVTSTVHPNLLLLPSGTESSIKVLTAAPQPKLEAVLQSLRLSADVIIFAVPPCDVLADASVLAKYMDDVCLVVSAAQTNYRSVPMAQDLLNKAGATNISIVLADASAEEEPFSQKGSYLTRV